MTLALADRIAQELADTGRPMTAEEIALALHVRKADVLAVLKANPRFARTLPGRRSPKANLYVVLADSELLERQGPISIREAAA